MRVYWRRVACAVAFVTGLTHIAYAEEFSEQAFKKELLVYRQSMKTLIEKFGPGWAIKGMFTPDFVFIGPDGKKKKLNEILNKENGLFLSAKADEIENWREASGAVPQKLKPKDEFWKPPIIRYEEVESEPQITLERFPTSVTTQTTQDKFGNDKKTKFKLLSSETQVFTRIKREEGKSDLLVMKRWEIKITKAFMDGVPIPPEAFKNSSEDEKTNTPG